MNLVKNIMPIAIILSIMVSCASSKIVLSNNVNIDKYKYVIFGNETSGDRELNDCLLYTSETDTSVTLRRLTADART